MASEERRAPRPGSPARSPVPALCEGRVAYGSGARNARGGGDGEVARPTHRRSRGAVAADATVFLVGMRTKSPAVVDRVRRFNRAVTNPRVLRSAGSPGASASVIRHVGRV